MIWLVIYLVGYFVCCIVMNLRWYDQFRKYDVWGSAFASLIWFIWAGFWLLGIIPKLIAQKIKEGK